MFKELFDFTIVFSISITLIKQLSLNYFQYLKKGKLKYYKSNHYC